MAAGGAEAQVVNADVGVNPTYEQTAGGVSSTGGFFSAFSTVAVAVPEPSTWAMLLIGFGAIGYAGYRSAQKKTAAAITG